MFTSEIRFKTWRVALDQEGERSYRCVYTREDTTKRDAYDKARRYFKPMVVDTIVEGDLVPLYAVFGAEEMSYMFGVTVI